MVKAVLSAKPETWRHFKREKGWEMEKSFATLAISDKKPSTNGSSRPEIIADHLPLLPLGSRVQVT